MDLREKAAQLPAAPGVYLYKDEYGTVLYVGKAVNLRSRVRSYFSDESLADSKTGTLIAEAYLRLGETYEKLKDRPASQKAYEKYLELEPKGKEAASIRTKLAAMPATAPKPK